MLYIIIGLMIYTWIHSFILFVSKKNKTKYENAVDIIAKVTFALVIIGYLFK